MLFLRTHVIKAPWTRRALPCLRTWPSARINQDRFHHCFVYNNAVGCVLFVLGTKSTAHPWLFPVFGAEIFTDDVECYLEQRSNSEKGEIRVRTEIIAVLTIYGHFFTIFKSIYLKKRPNTPTLNKQKKRPKPRRISCENCAKHFRTVFEILI